MGERVATPKSAPYFSDPERAAEAGRKSAEKRRAGKTAAGVLQAAEVDLAKALIDAALGRGAFADLPPDKRVPAIVKAMEYTHGKPAAKAGKPEQLSTPEEAEGLTIT